ncbi:hypothetical protein [Aminobacterium mobile]|uniref:hypothetical protein n=1 Tax=Aminobacterium mobile TaxID=81467 RepID=UPI002FDB535E
MASHEEVLARLVERYDWPKAVAVTGALGSGKTEWVLNLAVGLQAAGDKVTIADIDIINPYFCIRQVSETLESKGLSVITIPDQGKWLDMPLVTPKVDWALHDETSRLLMDIGGDAEGALALKQFEPIIKKVGYRLILVVNSFRPQTSTIFRIKKMMEKMENICGLEVNALICNSHLMKETTVADAVEGIQTVIEAGQALELPVLYAGVDSTLASAVEKKLDDLSISVPIWPLSRYMLLPWEDGYMWSSRKLNEDKSHS